ncbi:DUF6338 family protein [Streptomyces sp. NPDC012450]|uniref:DUF6338 family protein n=1 Tax=Streptomyces sp. NPDC012450 TaxID=3364834 RepID=UPI0036EAF1BF
MGTPSTVAQLALIVVAVLPGVTYQFVRERLLGSLPGEQAIPERILRALTASVALDAVYVVVLAPVIVRLATQGADIGKDAAKLREAGVLCIALIFIVPAIFAFLVSKWQLRKREGRYEPIPSAWDRRFRDLPSCFIRARLKDGTWVGGWYGSDSFATAYPRPPELYLELTWDMGADGSFISCMTKTQGMLLNGADVDVIEILEN